jgi:hypothetical protein
MWAATAAPVRPLNVSVHWSVAPVAVFVAAAVNVPRALATSPEGGGTSSDALIRARSWTRSAETRATAPPATTTATPTAHAMTAREFGLMGSSSNVDGNRLSADLRGARCPGFRT